MASERPEVQDTAMARKAEELKASLEKSRTDEMSLDGLTDPEVTASREAHGANEVMANQTPEWKKIVKRYLTDWVVLLMIAAAIIGVAVKNDGDRGYTSFVLLILEANLVVWVGYYSDRNAGNAVKELEELSAPSAMAKRNGVWGDVRVRDLVVGDLIQLKGGDVIPADSKLVGNNEPLKIDEASLTGESLAVNKKTGDSVLSGAVVEQGESEAIVTAVGENTFFGKTIKLLSRPEEKGHLQQVLSRVQLVLAIITAVAVIVILIVLLTRDEGVGYSIVTSFVILITCVPVGMPVVTTTVLAIGAREMAKEKALVNRLSALEELSGVEILASDKTGTLTKNKLSLDKEEIVAAPGISKDYALLMAALSARWHNADAIDTAVTQAVEDPKTVEAYKIDRLIPFNPVDKRTTAYLTDSEGQKLVTTKGAPQIVAKLLNDEEARQTMEYIDERASRGLRALAVANSPDGKSDWKLVGLISLLDPPRDDSAATIKEAQALGVEVKMITGDNFQIGVETARRLGMGTRFMEGKELMRQDITKDELGAQIAEYDGFAGVYPEHKFALVQAMQAKGMLIGMTGDGVNDAPALKAANVGIAVAGATPAAQGAADIVLTQEGIGTIITAINRSRKIFRRIECYIIYRISCSLTLLAFFFFGTICLKLTLPTWVLIVLSLTSDLSSMAVALDKVHTSDLPLLFNMTKCLSIAVVMSIIGSLGSLLLLAAADLGRWNWWPSFNILLTPDGSPPNITDGQMVAVIYMALTIIVQLNILSTRNTSVWFWWSKKTAPPPSLKLAVPVIAFLVGATFIAVYWPTSVKPDGGRGFMDGAGWKAVMLTWWYAVMWFSLADLAKAGLQSIFRKHTEHALAYKEHGTPMPAWTNLIDIPNRLGSDLSTKLANISLFKRKEATQDPPVEQTDSVADLKDAPSLKSISEGAPTNVSLNGRGETVVSFSEPRGKSSLKLERASFRNHGAIGGSGHLAN